MKTISVKYSVTIGNDPDPIIEQVTEVDGKTDYSLEEPLSANGTVTLPVGARTHKELKLLFINARNKKGEDWVKAYPEINGCPAITFCAVHGLPDGTQRTSNPIQLKDDTAFVRQTEMFPTDPLYTNDVEELEDLIFHNASGDPIDQIQVYIVRN